MDVPTPMPQAPEAALGAQSAPEPNAAPALASEASPERATEKPVSREFEVLARREREIVRKMQEAKQREKELEEREAKYKSFEDKRSSAKSNPLEALKELGLSYEDLTQFILNDQKPTADMEVRSVKDELRQLREDQKRQQQEAAERQKKEAEQAQAQAVENFKLDLGEFIETNAADYELLSLHGAQGVDLVYETIQTDWSQKLEKYEANGRIGRPPKIMSTEDAVKLVEGFIEKQTEDFYGKSKKLQSKYARAGAEPGAAPGAPAPTTKTLNNGLLSPSAPSMVSAQTDQERMARAMKALEG